MMREKAGVRESDLALVDMHKFRNTHVYQATKLLNTFQQ